MMAQSKNFERAYLSPLLACDHVTIWHVLDLFNGTFHLMLCQSSAHSAWTPARTALLIAHYQAGLSAAESARLMGDLTKNAVISKRRRLGLLGVASREEGGDIALAAGRAGEPRCRRASIRFRVPPDLPVEPLPDMQRLCAPDARPVRLADRGYADCAWPLGPAHEPGDYRTLYCGAPTADGGRYCATHALQMFRPRSL
jgi:hypothetical protein